MSGALQQGNAYETGSLAIRRTIKRLVAILTGLAGIPLLMIAGGTDDAVIRALTTIAGICLIISGSIQFWMLRHRRRRPSGDDLAY